MLSDNTDFWDLTEEVIKGLEENNIVHETTTLMSTADYKVQYTDEFYKRFGDKIITNGMYSFQYEFEDGHVERIPQESVVNEEMYFFKGYKCKPLMHDIDLVGNFSNTCFPKENLGIFFNKEQLTRQPRKGPTLLMPKFATLNELLATNTSDYQLLNYDPMLSIKAPMAV